MRDRHGSRGTRAAGRTWACPPRSSTAHESATTHDATEIAISDPRHPPSTAASGTATAAAIADPSWMPVAYTPVPVAGRSGTVSRTASGAVALPIPIPIPSGSVSATTSHVVGPSPRRTPNTPIRTSPIVIASRVPSQAESDAPTGANRPMQSTGIVPSSPAIAWDVSRSS